VKMGESRKGICQIDGKKPIPWLRIPGSKRAGDDNNKTILYRGEIKNWRGEGFYRKKKKEQITVQDTCK